MGIPLIAGREFSKRDNTDAPGVLIVNRVFAERYCPKENPIGKHIILPTDHIGSLAAMTTKSLDVEIVGVVGNERNAGLNAMAEPAIYFPQTQFASRSMSIVVRASSNPLNLANTIRGAVWSIDKDLPLTNIGSMDQLLSDSLAPARFSALLLGVFAAVALVLACVGLYGVMSYIVTQRTREIGIRMALGAQRAQVLRLVARQGLSLVSIGILGGIIAAAGLTRLMSNLLFGVSAIDPTTFGAIAILLTIVALVSCVIPAIRAARVDPMIALRYE